jgi:phosphatidylserine decarboxylase
MKVLLRLLTELSSSKFVSRIAGKAAKSHYSRRWIRRFASVYGIRLEDAEKPVEQYASLNEFFTRRLKPGLRPISDAPGVAVSPVDGTITAFGPVEEGRLMTIKGQPYTLEQLLHRSPRLESYKHGYFIVIYLSPSDYHRIHSPLDGTIVEREAVPGRTYPVNEFGLRHMRQVLSRNERLITYIRHASGETALVKVGAMNVSGIRYVEPLTDHVSRGQELAYFEFGSTVVLLFSDHSFTIRKDLAEGSKVKMGETLGWLQG